MFRKICSASCVCAVVLLLLAAHPKAPADPAFAQVDAIVRSLAEITGLSEKHKVDTGRMTKRQLRQFLNKRIKKVLRPDEIRADELSLKMFGLVPQEFDLKKSTVDLLTEQAAAFYDYDEKKLFLLDDSSFAAETTTLAHELSHALADQYFDLEHFMEDTPSNDDENLAHTAVVEGQASWLMIAYELKQGGQEPVPTAAMLKSVTDSGDASMADYPVLKGSPLYIQQSLLFPYSEGSLFFDAVYRKMGKAAFTAVFKDPPVDSAQVMHPAKYFTHEKPTKPALPQVLLTNEGKELSEGSVGEFDHHILIRQYLGEPTAARLSGHLLGGQFRIVLSGKEHKPVLEYASEWDGPDEAERFFKTYGKILQAKWRRCDISSTGSAMIAGVGDNGYFVTRFRGNVVSSVEGISDAADWRRLKAGANTPAASASALAIPDRLK
jgi:hypothetical protein